MRRVIRLAVARLTQSGHAVDLIFIRRTGQVLTVTEQKYGVGLQAFGAVVGQLLQASRFVRQARIHINYRLNMFFNQ